MSSTDWSWKPTYADVKSKLERKKKPSKRALLNRKKRKKHNEKLQQQRILKAERALAKKENKYIYKYYTIYKITSTVSNKVYIGQHKTDNIRDGYMGSGTGIVKHIEKHGKAKMKKEILFIFDNFTDMNNKEKELVTEEFIKRKDNYNRIPGGIINAKYIGSASTTNNVSRLKQTKIRKVEPRTIHKQYIVFKITSKITNKIYIGSYATHNSRDGFIGKEPNIKQQIKEYGHDSIKREILFTFDNANDMNNKEIELVNEEFVRRTDTYNNHIK